MKIFDILILEKLLILKSRWMWGTMAALVLILIFAGSSSYNLAKSGQPSLNMAKKIQGSNYKNWVETDEGANDLRATIQAIHPNMGANLSMAFLGIAGPLLLIILGASIMGSEFGYKTTKVRAAHHGWVQTVQGKAVLLVSLSMALVSFVVIAGFAANRIVWHTALSSIEISPWIKGPAVNYSLAEQFCILILGLSLYGLLGMFFALITRSTAVGIVLGIATPYVEQYLKQWWTPQASYGYLLGKKIVYAAGGMIQPPPGALLPPAALYSWLILIGWTLLLLAGLHGMSRVQET